jgi:hypothetical protein
MPPEPLPALAFRLRPSSREVQGEPGKAATNVGVFVGVWSAVLVYFHSGSKRLLK